MQKILISSQLVLILNMVLNANGKTYIGFPKVIGMGIAYSSGNLYLFPCCLTVLKSRNY